MSDEGIAMAQRHGDWIQTYTGKKFYPLDPRAEEVDIEDIAHALANICRFNGHTRQFYSVANHSVHVAGTVARSEDGTVQNTLWGLLHDAAEAYLLDLTRPVKRSLRRLGITLFDDLERGIMHAVCDRFGLPHDEPAVVKKADTILVVTEARDLMAPLDPDWRHTPENGFEALPGPIKPLTPTQAEQSFLDYFWRLTNS